MIRCVNCREEFPSEVAERVTRCPICASTLRPENPSHDVTLTLNWDLLRVLTQWAMNWAKMIPDESHSVLMERVEQLNAMAPEGAAPLLR